MKDLTATKANSITGTILSQLHLTGQPKSALIAQLLRLNLELTEQLLKEREASETAKKQHEAEKQNLLDLLITVNKAAGESSVPSTPSAEFSEPSTPSAESSESSAPSVQSSVGLMVPVVKTKDKVIF